MRNRRLIYGTNALILVISTLGILIILNYMASRSDLRFDLTDTKLFTVSQNTAEVLNELDSPIEIIAFFKDTGTDRSEFQDLIKDYSRRSDNLKVNVVNPDKEPGIAKKYEIIEYGSVVVVYGDETIKLRLGDPISGGILNSSEEEITNAILKLMRDINKTVYFLTGHGERDIGDDVEPEGLGVLKNALIDEGYNVREILLPKGEALPGENSVIVLAAPKQAFTLKEITDLKEYLDSGGKAVFMIEPRSGREIASVLKSYGIGLSDDIIVDPSSKLEGGGDIAPIVGEYAPHEITDDFRYATIFPYSRSIDALDTGGTAAVVLAHTGQYSWSETDFENFDQGVAQQEETDRAGPLGVLAVSENGTRGRIAVFGSVDFVSNIFFDFSGNRDLFLNTVNWVSGDENLISIRPKSAEQGKLTITNKQTNIIFFFTVILIPAVVLFSGVAIWWKRRKM
jgi:gliding motility-associatede transport system auxiliary component